MVLETNAEVDLQRRNTVALHLTKHVQQAVPRFSWLPGAQGAHDATGGSQPVERQPGTFPELLQLTQYIIFQRRARSGLSVLRHVHILGRDCGSCQLAEASSLSLLTRKDLVATQGAASVPTLEPIPRRRGLVRSHGLPAVFERRTSQTIRDLEHQTLVEVAIVRSVGLIQAEKLEEIDYLAREAMAGQAMLNGWAVTLAHGDPLAADDFKFFSDIAKLGKSQVIADTINSFSRGSC